MMNEGLVLVHFSVQNKAEASMVENRFAEEEVFAVVASLRGDKALGLDGFSMAF